MHANKKQNTIYVLRCGASGSYILWLIYIYMYSIVFHYSHAYQANGWPLLNPFEIIGTSATRIRKWVSTYGQFDQAKSVAVWGTSHFWTNPIPYNIILLNI